MRFGKPTWQGRVQARGAAAQVALLVGVLGGSAASAEPGDHIRVGDAVIAPALEAGFEYRSNVYREEVDPQSGANLRVAPGLEIGIEGEDARFSLSSQYEARKQVYVEFDANTVPIALRSTLDQAQATGNLDRWSDFSVDAKASLARQSVVGLELADQALYRNSVVDSELSDSPFLTQFKNALAGQIRLSPTGAVQVKPGGFWTYDDFRVPEFFAFAGLDTNEHEPFNVRNQYGPTLLSAWNFFPNTAWVIDARYAIVQWQADSISSVLADPSGGIVGQPLAKPDSTQIRITTGFRGRITPKLSAELVGGYGQAMYDETSVAVFDPNAAADARTYLLVAQVGWTPSEGSGVGLGYKRDFDDVFFTNFVAYHHIFFQASATLNDRFELLARYGLRLETYGGAVSRTDQFMRASFAGTYRFSDWASFGPTVWWQSRFSSDDLVEYDDVGLLISAGFQY